MGGTISTRASYPALRSRHGDVPPDPADHPRRLPAPVRAAGLPRPVPRRALPAADRHHAVEDSLPQAVVPEAVDGGDRAPEPGACERTAQDADRRHEPGPRARPEGDVEAVGDGAEGVPRGRAGAGRAAGACEPRAAAAAEAHPAGPRPGSADQARRQQEAALSAATNRAPRTPRAARTAGRGA